MQNIYTTLIFAAQTAKVNKQVIKLLLEQFRCYMRNEQTSILAGESGWFCVSYESWHLTIDMIR